MTLSRRLIPTLLRALVAALLTTALPALASSTKAPPPLAAGRAHSCAVLDSGDVACWGENARGQLGVPGEGRARPTRVPNARFVVDVAAGDDFTCFLHRSGRVRCFGAGTRGQLGDGSARDRPRPGPTSLTNARALASGAEHACAIVEEGEVRCWGLDRYGQVGAEGRALFAVVPVAVPGLEGARALALGDAHSCALLDDGSVRCWGGDFAGQRGDGDDQSRKGPTRVVGLSGVRALSSGAHHTCALDEGGAVWCWGAAAGGQLGQATSEDRSAPVLVPELEGAREIAAGGSFTCALIEESLRCLGGPFGARRDLPAKGAVRLVAGHGHACFRTVFRTTGKGSEGVRCVGDASSGQLGDGSRGGLSSPSPLRVPGLADAVRLAADADRTCALRANAEVSCWGNGRPAPTRVGDGTFIDVVVAGSAVAGRHEGDTLTLLEEDALTTRAHLEGSAALDFAAGRGHACALSDLGEVSCWGRGEAGQLGEGRRRKRGENARRPVRVRGLGGVLEVGAGAAHSCALDREGGVWCWGSHVLGELGHPSREGRAAPVRVVVPPAVELGVGAHHACIREEGGGVWCWGAGDRGQLGDGARKGSRFPVPVQGLDDAVALAVGEHHACAVRAEGEVRCWGEGTSGQLGDGQRVPRPSPVVVPGLERVVEVVAGARHTCARDEGGGVQCWGAGDGGQLGQGAPLFSDTPVAVSLP